MTINSSKTTAVVVHDDVTQLNLLTGLLQKEGIDANVFESAETALLEMDPATPPDLIVTDLYMPGIDGWRFCRLLRSPEYETFNAVPILVVSATFAGDEASRITADVGANAFIPTPVDGKRFVDTVQAMRTCNQPQNALRVLIVEDSRTVAKLLAKRFGEHGFRADMAENGNKALMRFAAAEYDIAVLDYHLPDVLGDKLLREFREKQPDCVCVMMTTDPNPELALEWMKAGAAAYLRKPFEPKYLIEQCTRARRERALLQVEDLLEVRTRELRESEEKHRRLLDESADPIFSFTPKGQYKYVNHAFAEGVGKPVEEIIGKTIWDIFPKEEADQRFAALSRIFRTGDEMVIEMHVSQKDGDRYYLTTVTPIKDAAGAVVSATCSSKEITERKQLESRLRQAQKMEAIGTLAGGIAHDFNNILFAMFGYLEMAINDTPEDNPVYSHLEKIFNGAERAGALVKQILTFSRRSEQKLKPLKTQLVIEEALKLIKSSLPSTIEISRYIKKDCGLVLADPTQIHQVVMNLCTNAYHAMEETSGELTVTLKETELTVEDVKDPEMIPGQYVCLTVADTGPGMPPDIIARIFDPYFTTKKTGKGTGLGLAVVHGIIKSHGGHISVYSEPGTGTEFRVYLPIIEKQSVPDKVTADSPIQKGTEWILLVDDEAMLADMEKEMLERLGYHVTARTSSTDALALFQTQPDKFDLVITDMTMPNMTGDKLAAELIKVKPDIPIILCTGFSELMSKEKAASLGIKGFLMKPIVMKDLSGTIRKVLKDKKLQSRMMHS